MVTAMMLFTTALWAADSAELEKPFWSKGRHFQLTGDVVNVEDDGIHDPSNITVKYLQQPYDAMTNFPRDNAGIVDWVQVLEQGLIDPRKSVDGKGEMFAVDFDIIFKNTASMPNVRFPHLAHTRWLACSNCHPDIFLPKNNGNPVNMEKVLKGQFCGRCHDKVSFALWTCERCHSVPYEKSPPAWWPTATK